MTFTQDNDERLRQIMFENRQERKALEKKYKAKVNLIPLLQNKFHNSATIFFSGRSALKSGKMGPCSRFALRSVGFVHNMVSHPVKCLTFKITILDT